MKKVFILGGGLQGCATAFYLSREDPTCEVTIIERARIGAAASGHGGGFLGPEGWAASPATRPLHRIGVAEHARLAQELNIKSFHRVRTVSVSRNNSAPTKKDKVAWLDGEDVSSSLMDDETAQVNPAELCLKLFEASGARLVVDAARAVHCDVGHRVTSLELEEGRRIEVDESAMVLIALGPWTGVFLEDQFGLDIGMTGVKSSSFILDTNGQAVHPVFTKDPTACFCDEDESCGTHLELYPRNDGTLYVAGLGGSDSVRGDRLRAGGDCEGPDMVSFDALRVEAGYETLSRLAPSLDPCLRVRDGVSTPVRQACMRPLLRDGLPVMDYVAPNALVSAGHNCWGITWAPACGRVLANLILNGKGGGEVAGVNLEPFSIGRFQ